MQHAPAPPASKLRRAMARSFIEWAVFEHGYGYGYGSTDIVKGGLGSREEAEAWMAALDMTRKREARERRLRLQESFRQTELYVRWREVAYWSEGDPPESMPADSPARDRTAGAFA